MPGLPIEGPQEGSSYDDAFAAALAAGGELPAAAAAEPAAAAPAEPAAAEAPAGGDPAPVGGDPAPAGAEPAAAVEDTTAEAPAAAEPAPAAEPNAAPAPSADDIVKGLADLLKQQPAPAAPTGPAAQEAPIYSAQDIQVLEEYEKNWPDVAQAEALRRKAEYHDLMKYVFQEVTSFVGPMADQLRAIQNNLHTGELKSLVPDYDPGLEEKVSSWVDQQPAYLQSGMKHVMQQGTSEEVADLIGRFRAATGASAPAAPVAAPAPAAAPKAELSKATKQAVASLAPVSGDRSVVSRGSEDPQDYDSAFAKYAASMPGI